MDDQGRELRLALPLVPRVGLCQAEMELLTNAKFVDLNFEFTVAANLSFEFDRSLLRPTLLRSFLRPQMSYERRR